MRITQVPHGPIGLRQGRTEMKTLDIPPSPNHVGVLSWSAKLTLSQFSFSSLCDSEETGHQLASVKNLEASTKFFVESSYTNSL